MSGHAIWMPSLRTGQLDNSTSQSSSCRQTTGQNTHSKLERGLSTAMGAAPWAGQHRGREHRHGGPPRPSRHAARGAPCAGHAGGCSPGAAPCPVPRPSRSGAPGRPRRACSGCCAACSPRCAPRCGPAPSWPRRGPWRCARRRRQRGAAGAPPAGPPPGSTVRRRPEGGGEGGRRPGWAGLGSAPRHRPCNGTGGSRGAPGLIPPGSGVRVGSNETCLRAPRWACFPVRARGVFLIVILCFLLEQIRNHLKTSVGSCRFLLVYKTQAISLKVQLKKSLSCSSLVIKALLLLGLPRSQMTCIKSGIPKSSVFPLF